MSTRSTIAIKQDNTIKAVYCHYDGYIEYVGRILHQYYQDSDKVLSLIEQGDLSSLGVDIGVQHDFNARTEYSQDLFAKQCTFYTRDRGENCPPSTYSSVQDWVLDLDSAGVEYYYLYQDGRWTYSRSGYWSDFQSLEEKIQALEAKEKLDSVDLVD